MSLRAKWLLTIAAFLCFGLGLGTFFTAQILLGAGEGAAKQWLVGVYQHTVRQQVEQIYADLGRAARGLNEAPELQEALADEEAVSRALAELWPTQPPGTVWLILDDGGGVRSSLPACASAELSRTREHPEGTLLLCGETPVLMVSTQAPGKGTRLALGRRIDELFIDDLSGRSGVEAVAYVRGAPVASSFDDGAGASLLPRRPAQASPGSAQPFVGTLTVEVPGYRGFEVGTHVRMEEGTSHLEGYGLLGALDPHAPDVEVLLLIPFDAVQGAAFAAIWQFGFGSVVILSLLLLVAWRLVRRLTDPLDALVESSRRVGDGDLAVRLDEEGPSELAAVGHAFNEMVKKLAASRDSMLGSDKLVAIGQLAAGVAHEINNPLGVILGFAQGMEKRVPEGDPMRLPVSSIVREAMRCKSLVQELLTFSRTANKMKEPVQINDVIKSSVVLLASRGKSQSVALHMELEDDLPLVSANKTQLQQVIVNLVNNALDATEPGGAITLRTRRHGDGVRFEVEDTGSGIPIEVRARIFEPFFTTKETGKGTGLGLSLVWEIVEQHGGRIDVESEVGAGTTFLIELRTLPKAEAQGEAV